MGLFSNPIVLTDGTSPASFAFRAQIHDKYATIGEWIEPAGDLSADSKLVIKHTASKKQVRRLLQVTGMFPLPDGTLKPIVINFTVNAHPLHTIAQIETRCKYLKSAIEQAGFVPNFCRGLI